MVTSSPSVVCQHDGEEEEEDPEEEERRESGAKRFRSGGIVRRPGDRWMLRGPIEYVPPINVEVVLKQHAIPLDENEGIYVRDMKTGKVAFGSEMRYCPIRTPVIMVFIVMWAWLLRCALSLATPTC